MTGDAVELHRLKDLLSALLQASELPGLPPNVRLKLVEGIRLLQEFGQLHGGVEAEVEPSTAEGLMKSVAYARLAAELNAPEPRWDRTQSYARALGDMSLMARVEQLSVASKALVELKKVQTLASLVVRRKGRDDGGRGTETAEAIRRALAARRRRP